MCIRDRTRSVIGLSFEDRAIMYNPNPLILFQEIFQEIARNFSGLISGKLSPKYFGGPVMIIQVMQQSWGIGIQEALFWIGAISLNLGIFNLLPVPVLDGGHICFAFLESVRKKPLKSKTMRRCMIPFIVLLLGFILFVTYNDLMRIFS